MKVGSIVKRLPTPEDTVFLKSVAHRPQDLSDIQAIAASSPDLDKARVQFWVEQFGPALESPNLCEKISKLL